MVYILGGCAHIERECMGEIASIAIVTPNTQSDAIMYFYYYYYYSVQVLQYPIFRKIWKTERKEFKNVFNLLIRNKWRLI